MNAEQLFQVLDFARAAMSGNVENAVAFRVIMEIEDAFVSLGANREALRKLMEECDE